MNINYFDLYYTAIKKRDDEEIVNKKMKKLRMIILIMRISLCLIIIYQLNLVKQNLSSKK